MSEAIYAWEMRSEHRATKYEVVLWDPPRADGRLSCDCPGWVYLRKGKPRGCKHVDRVRAEADRILSGQMPAGTIEPIVDPTPVPVMQKTKPVRKPGAKAESPLQAVRRRMICLDDDVAQA